MSNDLIIIIGFSVISMFVGWKIDRIFSLINKMKMDNAEMLKKIESSEVKVINIVKEIMVLKDLVLKGGEVSPEIVAAFERLDGHIQQADDLNPDVPVTG